VVIAISIVLIVTSLLMVLLVLLHKGKGGGLSDLFGGGVTSSLGSS
jgi:preprotein translocase subunit SecG